VVPSWVEDEEAGVEGEVVVTDVVGNGDVSD